MRTGVGVVHQPVNDLTGAGPGPQQPLEHVDLMQECGVLHHHSVGRDDGLAHPDELVGDPTERDHRVLRSARTRSSGTPGRGDP